MIRLPKKTLNNTHGFSMVEVIIASVIFTLTTAGIFATIQTLNTPGIQNEREVNAAILGRTILEELRLEVDSRTWDEVGTSLLHPNGGPANDGLYTQAPVMINGITYNAEYQVTLDPDTDATGRIVTITITWS